MGRVTALILLLLALPSFAFGVDSDRSAEEDNIREAVFRYLFDHNASAQQHKAHAYCLAIMHGDRKVDPSDKFIERFARQRPRVRKASACHTTEVQVVENRSGRSALFFPSQT
jgi:hypothetical protein